MSRPGEPPLRADVLAAAMRELHSQRDKAEGELMISDADGSRINVEGVLDLAPILQAALAAFVADDLR